MWAFIWAIAVNTVLSLPTLCYCCSVAKSLPTLCDPMDYSPPSSSSHGILQARILDCIVISFSRGSSWPRDRTCVSCIFPTLNLYNSINAVQKEDMLLLKCKCDHINISIKLLTGLPLFYKIKSKFITAISDRLCDRTSLTRPVLLLGRHIPPQ